MNKETWGIFNIYPDWRWGALDKINGGSDVCATIEASYDALHTTDSNGYQCNEECTGCSGTSLSSLDLKNTSQLVKNTPVASSTKKDWARGS